MYVCDRQRCEYCCDECNHTYDITHAKYSDHPTESFVLMRDGSFMERIRK